MGRWNDKTARWKYTFVPSSTGSRMIGHGSYQWQSLLTTTPRTPSRVTNRSSSIVVIILGFSSKTSAIHAPNLPQAVELKKLINVYRQNPLYIQYLQKQSHDKRVKSYSYASSEKVWLNSKHIKTKRNWKLKPIFFGSFRVLHPVGKQAYKLELPAKWRIHNMFHMSLLEQDITRKGWINEFAEVPEFELSDDKE